MKVAIIDHQPVFRLGLRRLLAESRESVICELGTGQEAIAEVERLREADVITVEGNLPDSDGISLVGDLRHSGIGARCLMLATFGDVEYVRRALDAGACGYALKRDAPADTLEAIRLTASGGSYLSPLLRARAGDSSKSGLTSLSPRERQIFSLVIQGLHGREIAHRLRISAKTVESHRYKINYKLGVHSVGELVRFAALHGVSWT
jgi:two-component system, NarL family, response regulator FusR